MTAKPIALEKARRAKREALDRIAELEAQNHSFCMLLGCMLIRGGAEALTFDVAELEEMDPGRVVLISMHGKVIVGLKKTGDEPLELNLTPPEHRPPAEAVSGVLLTCKDCGKEARFMAGSLPSACEACAGDLQ